MKPALLLVDDDPGVRLSFKGFLSETGYAVETAASRAEAQEMLLLKRFDAVLLDVNLPDGSGVDWISDLREGYPWMAIIVITGYGDVPVAVEAMRLGADNFLPKPVKMADLHIFLQKSLELGNLRKERLARKRLENGSGPYLSGSPHMKKVMELATVAAANDLPVLILGETGSGKGVLARWIHENSSRSGTPVVEVNCSSLRGELLASELFGHARGSFTSAVADRQGLIEVADGGTLFLDEVGDMDLSVQAQFLKVIEEKRFRRLGEVKARRSEFRLICATNKDLLEETRGGRFRIDLYFRIYVFPIVLPPLRQRQEDLHGLVRYMLKSIGKGETVITPDAWDRLAAYHWPGNIRELRNVIERAVLLSGGNPVTPEYLPGMDAGAFDNKGAERARDEESAIAAAINDHGGDMRKAAKSLGMSRATLYRRLKRIREGGG